MRVRYRFLATLTACVLADLAPVEAALATAQKHGTSAFDASGDTAGLECKGGDEWSSPPAAMT
jgi:hypothetical protein